MSVPDDQSEPGASEPPPLAVGSSGKFAAARALVTSALRPASLQAPARPSAPAPEAVLACVGQTLAALAPDAGERAVAEAFGAALAELLPDRLISIRVVDADAVGSRGAGAEAPRTDGAPRAAATDRAIDGIDAPVFARGALVAVISIERTCPDDGLADDASVAFAVAPFLGAALAGARANRLAASHLSRLRAAADSASDAIAVVDRGGALSLANDAFAQWMRRPREALLGHALAAAVPAEARGPFGAAIEAALSGEVRRVELALSCEEGEVRHAAFVVSPVRMASGELDGAMLVGRDVTELRVLEAQVVRADKLATLGQFAAGILHEINNPLTAIISYAEHLGRRMVGDPADKTRAERIGEAATRIQGMARRILSYARPAPEHPAPTSLPAVVEEAVQFCDHLLSETGAVVEQRFEPGLPAVRGVHAALTQVFVNLITNACHAVEHGRGRVVIAAASAGAAAVRVTVEDNGHGIAASHLARIFEPFYTTKQQGEGTGLGLAIVRSILDAHGATLRVDSRPRQGTRFEIDLPVASPDEP